MAAGNSKRDEFTWGDTGYIRISDALNGVISAVTASWVRSPIHVRSSSSSKMTGMRSWTAATSVFAATVTMANRGTPRVRALAGSHMPAQANGAPLVSVM